MKLNGEMVYLWRAVDHEGEVRESYVSGTRSLACGDAVTLSTIRRRQ
ncbi:MAG: DDE-type integrase/transposase/recombinase [Sphingomonas adhaesiva]